MEEEILPDFIEHNWKMILHDFDIRELEEWIADKEYEESWENWKNECIEEEHEYEEYKLEEYCWSVIEIALSFSSDGSCRAMRTSVQMEEIIDTSILSTDGRCGQGGQEWTRGGGFGCWFPR